jgi:hypothetical protein
MAGMGVNELRRAREGAAGRKTINECVCLNTGAAL